MPKFYLKSLDQVSIIYKLMRTLLVLLLDNLFMMAIFVQSYLYNINYNQSSTIGVWAMYFIFFYALLICCILKIFILAIHPRTLCIFYTSCAFNSNFLVLKIIVAFLDAFLNNNLVFIYVLFPASTFIKL